MTVELKIPIRPEVAAADVNRALGALKQLFTFGKSQTPASPIDAGKINADLRSTAGPLTRMLTSLRDIATSGRSAGQNVADGLKQAEQQAGKLNSTLSSAKGLLTGGALLGFAAGLGKLGKEAISANSEMEKYEIQIGTLIKGNAEFKARNKDITDPLKLQALAAEEAKKRLGELSKFGAETPFELNDIANAEKVLLGFGLTGQKAMQMTGKSASDLRTIAGDVAAATGQSFGDISLYLGKFSSGATGESIARLQELGVVTKEELKGMGIEFDKAGALTSPVDKALTATVTIMQQKFGGGMAQLSSSFEGQISTLKDNAGAALREMGKPIFEALRGALGGINQLLASETIQKGIAKIGQALAPLAKLVTDSLSKILPVVLKLLGPVIDVITTLLVPISGIISSLLGNVTGLIEGIAGPLGTLLNTLAVALVGAAKPIIDALLPAIGSLFQALGPIINVIASLATAIVPLIQIALIPMSFQLQVVAKVAATLLGAIAPLIAQIGDFATRLLGELTPALTAIAEIATEVATLFADVFAEAISIGRRVVIALFEGLVKLLIGLTGAKSGTDLFAKIIGFARNAVQGFIGWLQNLRGVLGGLQAAFAVVKAVIADFIDAVSNFDVAGAIKAFSGFGDKVAAAYKKGAAAARQLATAASDATKEVTATPDVPAPTIPPPSATTNDKKKKDKEAETEFQRAKRLFGVQEQELESARKLLELNRETQRISEKRARSLVDELIGEKGKLETLQAQQKALNDLLKITGDGTIGIKFKNDMEEADARKLVEQMLAQVQEQANKFAELRLKLVAELNPSEEINKLIEQKLRLDVEMGVVDKRELETFLQDDAQRMFEGLTAITQAKIRELREAQKQGIIDEQEMNALITRAENSMTKEQRELQIQLNQRRKEINDLRYDRQIGELEKTIAAEDIILKKARAIQDRFLENAARLAEKLGSSVISREQADSIKTLDREMERELAVAKEMGRSKAEIEEEFERRRLEATEKAERKRMALAERLRGQQLEAERQRVVAELELEGRRLAERQAIAKSAGRVDEAKEIEGQLTGIRAELEDKGSAITLVAGELQSNLTELFTNLIGGDSNAIRDPFRKGFAVLAGALQRLASAKVTEVLLGSISGLTGITGLIATLGLKPVIEGVINGLLGPLFDSLLSFSTGGRVDSPTLAIVGDAGNLGGRNREWIFRDDQLRTIMAETTAGALGVAMAGFAESIRGVLSEAFGTIEFRLRGQDIAGGNKRATQAQRRRRIIKPRR